MKKPKRVGFIGAGFNGNFHLRALQSVRDVELTGVYALEGAEELAAKARNAGLGDTNAYGSIGALCGDVDVICIFSPNFVRIETMRAIAEIAPGTGLQAVICEKPLGRTVAEATEMVELADSAGLKTAYFENQIHMPSVVSCRAQLANVAKKMGPVALTRSAEEHGGPHSSWFWDPTKQGGGVWCDMGCHSVAAGMHMLTPDGESPDFLIPVSVNATMGLLKWGREPWLGKLLARGVDYKQVPAEDYVTATITFRNPKTGQIVIAQANDSWMYDAPGLRLLMEALGPGYSYTINSLTSPAGIFISDAAAEAVKDAEFALEKSQANRGSLTIQPNEPCLYGYIGEWRDALEAFGEGKNALLDFKYGALIAKLVAAGYKSAEERRTIFFGEVDQSYVPKIHQGKGAEVLL